MLQLLGCCVGGLKSGDEWKVPYNEEEIRALLREAHIHGNLTGLNIVCSMPYLNSTI